MNAEPVITREVVYVRPEQPLSTAYRSMQLWKVRHLPVVEGGKLVGILSDRDVLGHATRLREEIHVPAIPVRDVMADKPITIRESASVSKAAELMVEYKIDALPVVREGDKLVGLVTSTDLLVRLIGDNSRVDGLRFAFSLREA